MERGGPGGVSRWGPGGVPVAREKRDSQGVNKGVVWGWGSIKRGCSACPYTRRRVKRILEQSALCSSALRFCSVCRCQSVMGCFCSCVIFSLFVFILFSFLFVLFTCLYFVFLCFVYFFSFFTFFKVMFNLEHHLTVWIFLNGCRPLVVLSLHFCTCSRVWKALFYFELLRHSF